MCGATMLGWPDAKSELCAELKLRYKEERLAIANVQGKQLNIVPFGESAFSVALGLDYYMAGFFSPDGRTILGEPSQLAEKHILSIDGTLLRSVPLRFGVFRGALAPDGMKFAAEGSVRTERGEKTGLMIVYLNGREPILVATGAMADLDGRDGLGWSPQGDRLVYERDEQVKIYDLSTGRSTVLVPGRNPTWSPDGKWIAYQRAERRSPNGNWGKAPAMISGLDGKATKVLMSGRPVLSALRWSPDSKYLLFGEEFHRSPNGPRDFDPGSRLVVYRLADEATCPVLESRSDVGGVTGRDHGWVYLKNR